LNAGNEQALTEWEYIPPVGPRPVKGFVGLKNAGATCYMNSVTQQVSVIWLFCSFILHNVQLLTCICMLHMHWVFQFWVCLG